MAEAEGARASELGARHPCWQLPDGCDGAIAAALVEGTVLASYRRVLRYLSGIRPGTRPAVTDA